MPDPSSRPLTVVVLAAGEGTRMRSRTLPKVLHGFAGRSMLGHVLAAVAPAGPARTVVVVGHRRDEVTAHLGGIAPEAQAVVQHEQKGTGHAVRVALESLPAVDDGQVLVMPGDAPLLTWDTIGTLLAEHARGADATIVTSVLDDPTGYGRVLRDDAGLVRAVVEHKDATDAERAVTEFNTSVYLFDEALLRESVTRLSTDNAQGEEYLTDVIGILTRLGRRVEAFRAPTQETAGVNDRAQLAAAHAVYNRRLLEAHMRAGVTVVDPGSTWIDADVRLGVDVTLRPAVYLHGSTSVADGATIGPDVTLTDTIVGADAAVSRCVAIAARLGAGTTVGPFAYLRPGATLADGVHVGTYVEVKNSQIGVGSKVPHLSYVGDATIGAGTNVGAATVFVNYDGVAKHRTVVGDHVRIGSDTMLVAPVEVGDGAYTAAGSVIDQDVPPGSMAVARSRQRNVAGWVERKRAGTASADAAARALNSTDGDGTV